MIKKIGIALGCLVAVIAIGSFLLLSNLDHIIKVTVDKYASAATQANVSLNDVKISLTSGQGQLGGLSVGNPKGFSTPNAFYLGSIEVQLDTSSIKDSGPIVIKKIVIEKPQVTYELLNDGSSNLQAIQNNVQAYASAAQSNKNAAPAAADSGKSAPGRKIVIDDLVVRDGQISISQTLLKGKQINIPLPVIHLTNIGKSSGGASPAQVAQQIFSALANSAAQASVVELAKDKISGVINAVPVKAIGGAASDTINNSVKSLFGN